jgi:hypothetical protein
MMLPSRRPSCARSRGRGGIRAQCQVGLCRWCRSLAMPMAAPLARYRVEPPLHLDVHAPVATALTRPLEWLRQDEDSLPDVLAPLVPPHEPSQWQHHRAQVSPRAVGAPP